MEAEMEELKKQGGSVDAEESFIDPQINPTEGLGERKAVQRRKGRPIASAPDPTPASPGPAATRPTPPRAPTPTTSRRRVAVSSSSCTG
jgi:hypothetical protein